MAQHVRGSGDELPAAPASVHDVLRSPGTPLDAQTRAWYEPRLGVDLSEVRVHDDAAAAGTARAVQASAYTVGQHIVLGAGNDTASRREVLAHELTHAAQQRDVGSVPDRLPISSPGDADEVVADRTARAVLAGEPSAAGPVTTAPTGLQRDFDSTITMCHRVLESRRFHVSNGMIEARLHATWSAADDTFAPAPDADRAPRYYYVSLHKDGWLHDSEIATEPVPIGRAVTRSWSGLSEGDYHLFFWTVTDSPQGCLRGEISLRTPAAAATSSAPALSTQACFDGDTLYVSKDGQTASVPALSGTVGDPTPEGDYGLHPQGEAQIKGGWKGRLLQDRDRWFLLEPMFSTSRFRMQLHPGTMSSGCITVMDGAGFDRIAMVLNSGANTTMTGTDGYPPGNSSGTVLAPKSVPIVGTLHVAYGPNGCAPALSASPPTASPAAHLARYPDPPAAVSVAAPLPAATTTTAPPTSTTRADGSAIPGGWSTGAAGPNAAPSRVGTVERVPIEGLPGNQAEQASLPGAGPAATSTARGPQSPDGAGRAVALVPDSVRTGGPGPVDVLLHLHGLGSGMRRRAGDPTDVGDYDMPQQVQAFVASRPSERLIALMPIGVSVSPTSSTDAAGAAHWRFQNTSFGALDPDTFIRLCFARLAASLPPGATPGRVILSAHSGGGLEVSRLIAANRLPTRFAGLFSFESVHGDLPTWTAFVLRHLDADLAELRRLHTSVSDPALLLAAQRAHLASSGFRFVAMARAASGYGGQVRALRATIVDWFGRHATDLSSATAGQNSLQDLLWANYQAVAASTGTHDAALATAHHNLGRALATLPPPAGTPTGAASIAAASIAAPSTTTAPPAAGPAAVQRQPGPGGSFTAATAQTMLTDATVALGRLDGATGPPDHVPDRDHTRLGRVAILAAIGARATNPDLQRAFDDGTAAIVAAADADRADVLQAWARGVKLLLENQFISDPARSALDLDPVIATRYRDRTWDTADYPGGPVGPHEAAAKAMAGAMTNVVPERRPNSGSAAVMTSAELTTRIKTAITANLTAVPGQARKRLLTPAATAFDRMQTIAAFDGVDLVIDNSFRSFATATANAAAAGNPSAVASFSSHSLGLAVDFTLSSGTQHFTEMTTRPMQNVASMRSSVTHKWMVLHAEEFGWFPYGNEPWHWEYNPPGFRDVFRALVFPPPAAPAPTPAPPP